MIQEQASGQAVPELTDDVRRRYEGVREFLHTLDRMRSRPTARHGDIPLPILRIKGSSEAVVLTVQVLEERYRDGPFALVTTGISGGPPTEDRASDKQLAEQLREVAETL